MTTPCKAAIWVRLIVAERDESAVRRIFRACGALEYSDADARDPEPPSSLAGIAGVYLDFRGGAPSVRQPESGPLGDLARAGIPAVGVYRDAVRCAAFATHAATPGFDTTWQWHRSDADGWPIVRVGFDGEPLDEWVIGEFMRERGAALAAIDDRSAE